MFLHTFVYTYLLNVVMLITTIWLYYAWCYSSSFRWFLCPQWLWLVPGSLLTFQLFLKNGGTVSTNHWNYGPDILSLSSLRVCREFDNSHTSIRSQSPVWWPVWILQIAILRQFPGFSDWISVILPLEFRHTFPVTITIITSRLFDTVWYQSLLSFSLYLSFSILISRYLSIWYCKL